jgi:hypothetical protein
MTLDLTVQPLKSVENVITSKHVKKQSGGEGRRKETRRDQQHQLKKGELSRYETCCLSRDSPQTPLASHFTHQLTPPRAVVLTVQHTFAAISCEKNARFSKLSNRSVTIRTERSASKFLNAKAYPRSLVKETILHDGVAVHEQGEVLSVG